MFDKSMLLAAYRLSREIRRYAEGKHSPGKYSTMSSLSLLVEPINYL